MHHSIALPLKKTFAWVYQWTFMKWKLPMTYPFYRAWNKCSFESDKIISKAFNYKQWNVFLRLRRYFDVYWCKVFTTSVFPGTSLGGKGIKNKIIYNIFPYQVSISHGNLFIQIVSYFTLLLGIKNIAYWGHQCGDSNFPVRLPEPEPYLPFGPKRSRSCAFATAPDLAPS